MGVCLRKCYSITSGAYLRKFMIRGLKKFLWLKKGFVHENFVIKG